MFVKNTNVYKLSQMLTSAYKVFASVCNFLKMLVKFTSVFKFLQMFANAYKTDDVYISGCKCLQAL